MIPELGQFCLVLAACLALGACWAGFWGAQNPASAWLKGAASMVIGQFVFCTLAFAALVWSFVTDDFSVAYVANHSHSQLPLYYKVAATWGGHEGSFLLWIVFMTLWMAFVAAKGAQYPAAFHGRVLGVLSFLNLGFIGFALFASEPFVRLIPLTPGEGSDLNPLLQDFGQTVHPPMLYAGYVGLAVPFAFAVAALVGGQVNAVWARWTRPWTNVSWGFLTLGIALGSWWAYYELGWGGWWFWDPVENASFMPWLAATALLHSLAVTEKRGAFRAWTLLLAIACFSLSLLGSFIVRSGVLTSVHAFAVDPQRGMYILVFLSVVVGGSLLLYGLRAGRISTHVGYRLISRESFMLLNNVALVIALMVVLWGTLYPIGYQAVTGDHISVGPPFFNRFFVPLMLALTAALAVVPVLNWKKTSVAKVRGTVAVLLPVAVVVTGIVWFIADYRSLGVLTALALALWVLLTHGVDLVRRLGHNLRQPLAYWGMTVAHLGFAMSVAGVAVTATQSLEEDVRMAPQDTFVLGDEEVRFLGITASQGPNYHAQQGIFIITPEGGSSYELRPEKRRYVAGGSVMTEAAVNGGFFADTYISLGEPLDNDTVNGAWAVRLHRKPLVRWVWYGAVLMAFGGMLAVFDARYRRLRRRYMQKTAAAAGPPVAVKPS